MNSQMFAGKRFFQKLSTGELVGLSATGIVLAILIFDVIFLDAGAAFLLWHTPNVIFATIAVGATFVLVRREQLLTFKQALGIVAIGIATTSVLAIPLIGWMFRISFDKVMMMASPFILLYYGLYVLPVMSMFLLGAAQTSRQLFVSSLLLLVVLVALVVPIRGVWSQFQTLVFFCVNVLLGFPLTVLGQQYSSR